MAYLRLYFSEPYPLKTWVNYSEFDLKDTDVNHVVNGVTVKHLKYIKSNSFAAKKGQNINFKLVYNEVVNNFKVLTRTKEENDFLDRNNYEVKTSDNKTFTINTLWDNCEHGSTLIDVIIDVNGGSGEEEQITITKNFTNVTSDNTPNNIIKNSEFSFNLVADNGYILDNLTANIGEFERLDNSNAIFKGVATEDIVITATAIKVNTPILYINCKLINCSCNFKNGDVINYTDNIIITANNGYSFESVFTYQEEINGVKYEIEKTETGELIISGYRSTNIYLNEDIIAVEKLNRISNFVNIYKVNDDILNKLSKIRFINNLELSKLVDYGEFITKLYALPFKLDNKFLSSESNIILGNYDSGISALRVNQEIIMIDMGNINIDNCYQDNTKINLHGPLFDVINLPLELCNNSTINIKYVLNVYQGECNLNVYSKLTGGIIESKQIKIGLDIPFIQKQNNTIVNKIDNVVFNSLTYCYVEKITENFTKLDLIKDYTGFKQFNKIQLNSSATIKEKDEILNILNEGIYINDNNS